MNQSGWPAERQAPAPGPAGVAPPATLIVGMGSSHGDDQAGWLVADALDAVVDHRRVSVRQATSPTQLLAWLDGVSRLLICDACHGLGRVGDLGCWRWPTPAIQAMNWSGTHDLSLPATLSLAERLGHLPPEVNLWAIEAGVPGAAEQVSAPLTKAVSEAVRQIAGTVAAAGSLPQNADTPFS